MINTKNNTREKEKLNKNMLFYPEFYNLDALIKYIFMSNFSIRRIIIIIPLGRCLRLSGQFGLTAKMLVKKPRFHVQVPGFHFQLWLLISACCWCRSDCLPVIHMGRFWAPELQDGSALASWRHLGSRQTEGLSLYLK